MSDEYSLDDELTRKAGEAALWLDGEIKRGALTQREAYAALVTFDQITLGLIDRQFNDWAREEREKKWGQSSDLIVLHRPASMPGPGTIMQEMVVTVRLDRLNEKVIVLQVTKNPAFKNKVHDFADMPAAQQGFFDMIERLESKGMKRVQT
jgi:hypothetical protein